MRRGFYLLVSIGFLYASLRVSMDVGDVSVGWMIGAISGTLVGIVNFRNE